MAVKIRLTRRGSKKKPFYRLVAADSRSPRDGKFLDILGYYNPLTNPVEVKVHRDRLDHWIKKGALMSDSVRTLLKREKLSGSSPAKD